MRFWIPIDLWRSVFAIHKTRNSLKRKNAVHHGKSIFLTKTRIFTISLKNAEMRISDFFKNADFRENAEISQACYDLYVCVHSLKQLNL